MKYLYRIYCLLLVSLSLTTYATHIVGGEMSYRQLAVNNYEITLKLYRDCYNGIPPFDDPAFITIFNSSGNIITTAQLSLQSYMVLTPVNTTSCGLPPSDLCVEIGTYKDTISLPPIVGGYTITYQRCCRTSTLLNIFEPSNTGASYWTHIPGPEVVSSNNSPVFSYIPPFYFCSNTNNNYSHYAYDDDGDSLVYFLASPFNGLDACCPTIGAFTPQSSSPFCQNPPTSCPTENTPPPYQSVTYSSGYNSFYPINASPAISIHPYNGQISLTPNLIGDFALCVGVNEYRNNNLIGTYYRDFHTKVTNCQTCTNVKKDLATLDFDISPNPANKFININIKNFYSPLICLITDVFGRTIQTLEINNDIETIDVSTCSKGVYFVHLISKNGIKREAKLIIE